MSGPTITPMPPNLPLSSLRTIDIQALRDDSPAEKARLLTAAKEEGFFYLDFSNLTEFENFKGVIDGVYELEQALFGLTTEEKLEFDVDAFGPMKLNGYKPIGRNLGGVGGKRDGFESWAIPKDGVLSIGKAPFPRPAVLDARMGLLDAFMKYMQTFTSTMHSALSDTLGIEGDKRLELFHRNEHSSPCILRLLKYHEQPAAERGAAQTPHTDLGSLTVLFTAQPGLQTLPYGGAPDDWTFVAPKPNCAIVNVGDSLSMMTGGKLTSSLHRVGPLPGHAMATRYSFAYLQRPEEHTIFQVPGSIEEVTSGEWVRRKFGMLRKNTYAHDKQWILTGRHQEVIAP
ncbi:hypothetical protein N0V90_005393 [Kalmusia sp. IMI 367209]|nr:hypothetical protein N0V90_005393 [Kalmusia sp. IMI 367209]